MTDEVETIQPFDELIDALYCHKMAIIKGNEYLDMAAENSKKSIEKLRELGVDVDHVDIGGLMRANKRAEAALYGIDVEIKKLCRPFAKLGIGKITWQILRARGVGGNR